MLFLRDQMLAATTMPNLEEPGSQEETIELSFVDYEDEPVSDSEDPAPAFTPSTSQAQAPVPPPAKNLGTNKICGATLSP
ncbi:hypothetical protein FKM82_008928 [Ascaphus truei]